ncbi:MAG TPA: hypothetical protein VER55_13805 [Ardenticatenaceae bacterium]|nr:hypothetical protein [Ardenticatenaceae bacterium]
MHDLAHTTRLAETNAQYRSFLAASLDENWVRPKLEALVQRSLRSFQDRFPLVIEDLLALPREPLVLAEGFGLTPYLVHPLLSSARQALWLVPTESFNWASMQRRGKPSFWRATSDAGRATRNLFTRDMLLAEHVQEQARLVGAVVVEVDGSRSVDAMVAVIETHFEPFLSSARAFPPARHLAQNDDPEDKQ